MTGRSIPRRYSKINQDTKASSRIEKSAVYFRSLQEFSATKPFMDATISVKVLNDGFKSSGSGKGKERTPGPDGDVDEGPKIKLDWNPRAKRKPGQILKLHASYRELTSKEGAKWGWVDPPEEISPEESTKALMEAIEWKKKQPRPVIKFYKNTSHGTHEIEPAEQVYFKTAAELLSKEDLRNESYSYSNKIFQSLSDFVSNTPLEVKKLGQTIGDILPGQRIDLGRALARGLIVDSDGKLRCPPGTPNANQFTDIDMSNCMVLSPKNIAQRLQNSIGRFAMWVNEGVNMGKEQDLIDSINPRFQRAKKNYTSVERNAEILANREAVIKQALLDGNIEAMLRAYGYGPDDDITKGNADLFAYLMGVDFANETDPDVIERALARIEGMFSDGSVWGSILDENGQEQRFKADANGEFIRIKSGPQKGQLIPDPNGELLEGYVPFKWDRTKGFKENMDAYNASIETTMLIIIGDQRIGQTSVVGGQPGARPITLKQAIDNFSDPLHPQHNLYKQAKEVLDNFTNAHEASKRGTLKSFIQHSVEDPEQYRIISRFEAFMPSHLNRGENIGDFWAAEGELSVTAGDGPIPGLILRSNTLGQIFKPYIDMGILTDLTQPSLENPFGMTATLDFDAQEGVEMSLAEKMSLWNQMISDITDADTFGRMLKQRPVTDEEKRFVQLQDFYTKYEGNDSQGNPIPRRKILDGAELQNVLRTISTQMGITQQDASNLWFQFGKANNMYANDASSARAALIGGGNSFLTALEAKAGHVAWHEIGHSLQYYAAGQQIQGFVDREGGFPLFKEGKLITELGPDTSLWTNEEWQQAIVSLTRGNPALMQNWPPQGAEKFEKSMIHLLAGAYYQDEVAKFWQNPSSTNPQMIVALHEAHVELFALKKMGVIEGQEVDEALEYFENVVPTGNFRYKNPPRVSPNPPPQPPPQPAPPGAPALPPGGPPGLPPGGPQKPRKPRTPRAPGGPSNNQSGTGNVNTGGGDINAPINIVNEGDTTTTINGDNITINVGDVVIGGDIIVNGEVTDPDKVTINVNVTINYPSGGDKPTKPKVEVEIPGTDGQPRVPDDLWPRIASHMAEDQATQWDQAAHAKTRVGRDRSRQKDWIDEVFGLTSSDTEVGGAGDETKDAFGQTKSYSEMTPEQLDARFEKIKSETDKLIERSKTEPLSENEQAKMWLGIKGMRQILHINRERAHMVDEKRAEQEGRGYNTKPGKYMAKADGTYPPSRTSKWKYRTALERHAAAGGTEISEIDEDELVHWHREIGAHAGSSFAGKPGFDASKSPYKKGELREKANYVTSADTPSEADTENIPTPDTATPDATPPTGTSASTKPRQPKVTAKTDPKGWGKKERDFILEWQAGEMGEYLNGDSPIEERESFDILMGPEFAEDAMSDLIRSSYKARKEWMEGGERPSKSAPNQVSPFIDEEITKVIAPMLRLLDDTEVSEDVEVHLAMASGDYEVGAGEIFDIPHITRGKIIDADSSTDMGSNELSTSRRIKIIVPAGSRGMPDKNAHNGDIDDMILPPGSFVVVDVDSDGTVTVIPHYQKSAPEVLETMLEDIRSLPAPENDLERLERERIAVAITDARSAKPAGGLTSNRDDKIPYPDMPEGAKFSDATGESGDPLIGFGNSSRSQRGVSGSPIQQKRMKSRNLDALHSQQESGSQPFAQNNSFVSLSTSSPDYERIGMFVSPADVQSRQQLVDSAVANINEYSSQLKKLIENPDADFIELRGSIPPDVLEFASKATPEELLDAVSNTMFNFHEGFDDRVHIPLQASGFDDVMKFGRVRPITEINPDSNVSRMRSARELGIGISPQAEPSARTVSGYMRHSSHQDAIQQHLDSLPSAAVKRNINNFLDTEDFSPFGDIRKGDASIDLVLLPEASRRSGYVRGDFMRSGNVPTPILSDSIEDINAAHMSLSDIGPSDRNAKLKQILNAVDSQLTGKQNKLWSSSDSRGKLQGDKFDAIVPNGVDFDEVSEIKIPNRLLDTSSFSLSIDEIGGVDMLKENGFSPKDRDLLLAKINSGEIELKNAKWLAEHRAAKEWQKGFRERFGSTTALTFTNPDGVDVMDRESFSGFPGIQYNDDIEQVLKKRIAGEIAMNAKKLLKDARTDKEMPRKLNRNVSPNSGMPDSSRTSDKYPDLQTRPYKFTPYDEERRVAFASPPSPPSPPDDGNNVIENSGSRSRRIEEYDFSKFDFNLPESEDKPKKNPLDEYLKDYNIPLDAMEGETWKQYAKRTGTKVPKGEDPNYVLVKAPFRGRVAPDRADAPFRDFSIEPARGSGPFTNSADESEIVFAPRTNRVTQKELTKAQSEMYDSRMAIYSPWGQPDEGSPEYPNYIIKHLLELNANMEVLYDHLLDIEDKRDENGNLTPSQLKKLQNLKSTVRYYEGARKFALKKLDGKISPEEYEWVEKSLIDRATHAAENAKLDNPKLPTPKFVKYEDLKPLPDSSTDELLSMMPPDDWAPYLTDPVERESRWQDITIAHARKHELVKVDGKLDARNLSNGSPNHQYDSLHTQQAIVDMKDGESILIENLPSSDGKHMPYGIVTKHKGVAIYSQLFQTDFEELESGEISIEKLPQPIKQYIQNIDELKEEISGTRLENIGFTAVYILNRKETAEAKDGRRFNIGAFVSQSHPNPDVIGTMTILNGGANKNTIRHEWGHLASAYLRDTNSRIENMEMFPETEAYKFGSIRISDTTEWVGAIESDKKTSSQIKLARNITDKKIISDADGVTEYGTTNYEEDFAESIAIYLEARAQPNRDWVIGETADGRKVTFQEMFPERFKLLNQIFDGKSEDSVETSIQLRDFSSEPARGSGPFASDMNDSEISFGPSSGSPEKTSADTLLKENELDDISKEVESRKLPSTPPDNWGSNLPPQVREEEWARNVIRHEKLNEVINIDGKLDARGLTRGVSGLPGHTSLHTQQAVLDLPDGKSILIKNLPKTDGTFIPHGVVTKHRGMVIYSQLTKEQFDELDSADRISVDQLTPGIKSLIENIDLIQSQSANTRAKNVSFPAVYILDDVKEKNIDGLKMDVGAEVIFEDMWEKDAIGTMTVHGVFPARRELLVHEWGHRVSRDMLMGNNASSMSGVDPVQESASIFPGTQNLDKIKVSQTSQWKDAIASDKQTSSQFEFVKHGYTAPIKGGMDGVTDYGTSNHEEDFAEALSIYWKARHRPEGDWVIGETADGRRVTYQEMFPARFKVLNELFDGKAEGDTPNLSGRPLITLDSPPQPASTGRPTIPVSPTAGRPNIPRPTVRPTIRLNDGPRSTRDILDMASNNMSAEDIAKATGMSLNAVLNIIKKDNS